MIKAVIFDMYETLITQYGDAKDIPKDRSGLHLMHGPCIYFRAQMAEDAGIDRDTFDACWEPTEEARTIGQVTLEEAIEGILKENNCYSTEHFEKIIESRKEAKKACFRYLHPEMIPMLNALKEKQMKVALISNCYSEEVDAIRESLLFPYFDKAYLSYEQGVKKPDAEIFKRCLADLQVKPGECLYIGDGGSHELEAASQAGMHAMQARWYISKVPFLDEKKEAFNQLDSPMDVLMYIFAG